MSYVEEAGDNPYAAPMADLSNRPSPVGKGYEYAGFWRRFAAVFIDSIFISFVNNIVGFALGFALAKLGTSMPVIQIVGILLSLCLGFGYYAGMLSSSRQATLGKMAMGIKVVDLRGRRIGFGRAFVRELAKLLSFITLFIGYFMAAFTERRQALHDMIAGTVVVKVR